MADAVPADAGAVPAVSAGMQKPTYETPKAVDVNGPADRASGDCMDGSGEIGHCHEGTSAAAMCYTGYSAGSWGGTGNDGEVP